MASFCSDKKCSHANGVLRHLVTACLAMSPDWLDLLFFYLMIALAIAAVAGAFAVIVAAIFFLAYRLPIALLRRPSLQRPRWDGKLRPDGQVVEIGDWSVATSGDYRNYREVDGKRISHLIDPRTGYPITHSLASVTVISKTCMTADGLATAISILGVEEGIKLLEHYPNSHAFFILRDGDSFSVQESVGFEAFKVD